MLAFSLFVMYLKRLLDDKVAVCMGGGGVREGGRLTMRRVATASMNVNSLLLIKMDIIEQPNYIGEEEKEEEEEEEEEK